MVSVNNLFDSLEIILHDDLYKRTDKNQMQDSLVRLESNPSNTFKWFYNRYEGPFWEESVAFELLDITEIESHTSIARIEHNFTKQYLVLSEMAANSVLVLDTLTDHVFIVNFEGGDEKLLRGELDPTWLTFYEFLKEYFEV
jgi:hypothetical protein